MTPQPLRRSRQHPYPPEVKAATILDVTRGPGKKHGNPFAVVKYSSQFMITFYGKPYWTCGDMGEAQATKKAVDLFREYLRRMFDKNPVKFATLIAPVKAADFLACWCALPPDGEPDVCCHRSVWREACEW